MDDVRTVILPDGREAFLVGDRLILPISGGGPSEIPRELRNRCLRHHHTEMYSFDLAREVQHVAVSSFVVKYCPVRDCGEYTYTYEDKSGFSTMNKGKYERFESMFLLDAVIQLHILKKKLQDDGK